MARVSIEKFKSQRIDEEYEENGFKSASLHSMLTPFQVFRRVLVHHQQPPKISLVYMRNCMRTFAVLPHVWKGESLSYRLSHKLLLAVMLLFAGTITCDLYESSQDFLRLGENFVLLTGIYLVILKVLLTAYYARDIEHIICEFVKMHKYFSELKKSPSLCKIHKLQRLFFLCEIAMFFFFINLAILFAAIICLCPILVHSGLTPYRAKFPFTLNTYTDHPILFSSVYVFQSIMTLLTLVWVVLIDSLGGCIFTQMTVNLKIFCIRIRELGCESDKNSLKELHEVIKFHQYLISLVTKINHIYYYNFTSQMVASTLMICLSAFESVLVQDQPLLAIKFQIYMFSAFSQLFYWCTAGNMVFYNSVDIADAAYEIDRWYEQSAEFGYCLGFLIKRAQTPLIFRPRPFFGYNFETFVSILSTSYTYFALLRTMSE